MNLIQAVTQIAKEQPAALLWTLFASAVIVPWTLLLTVAKRWANRLETKVDGFQSSLAAHANEDSQRFGEIEGRANHRHEAMMETLNRNANAATAAVSTISIEFAEVRTRLEGVEARLPERRESDR